MPELLSQPQIKDWMPADEINFRHHAIQYLHQASDLGLLPAPVNAFGIFPEGASSVVFKVNPETQPYVVKMATNQDKVGVEAACFIAWRKQGVKTPDVYTLHSADDQLPISLSAIEFISAPSLTDVMAGEAKVGSEISPELGRIMARMHQVTSTGFGELKLPDFTGSHSTLTEELSAQILDKKVAYLLQRHLITSTDIDSLNKAIQILEQDIHAGQKPSLTHNDFLPYNVLATEPPTVIDPDARITHPILDLATTLLISEIADKPYGFGKPDDILNGYREITKVDDRILSAALVVRAVKKLNTWAHKNHTQKIDRSIAVIRRESDKLK